MSRPTVLISGASIAGPALAFWLHRFGYDTTVVERADSIRLEGQNIDVRGAGREVARRMGVEDDIRAATTGEVGTEFLDERGRVHGRFPAGTSDSGGATAELEILRGSLARILVERTRTDTEFVFGDHVTALADEADRVTVTFAHAAPRRFDLVVVAEGVRSRTRRLVFGDAPTIRELGLYTAYLTIPRTGTDTDWWRWCSLPGSRSLSLRPDNLGTTRATLTFMSAPQGYEKLDADGQIALLRRVFDGVGGEAPRVLAALGDAPLYFDAVAQVRAPEWSRGRVALVGDAGYGPSPISGMGTSLSLVGAYVLAGELAAHTDHRAAFASYEKILRPYVEQAQQLPPGAPRLANPKTRAGVAVFLAGTRVAASRAARAVGGIGGRFLTPPADAIDLPTYVVVRR